MQSKKDFKYARLLNTKTGEYVTNGKAQGLVMGPETAKRYEQNDDDCAVTICCITYKHEDLIRDALDSFLRQKTNFKYKIFVGEDNGPDGTADIVREYAEKYPDKIVPFLRKKNMGAQTNLIDLCNHANSPYIAFCEGDDFWTDEYKLQKQYDYMQANENLRVCFARAEVVAPEGWFMRDWYTTDKDGKMFMPECDPMFKPKSGTFTCDDCIWYLPAHTSTHFYRWNYDLDIPDWYYRGIIGDQTIFLMQMGEGEAGYIREPMTVYRRTDVGIFMSDSMDNHFKRTRLDHLRWLTGIDQWYKKHQNNYPEIQIQDRIKHETSNYLRTLIRLGENDAIAQFFVDYPQVGMECLTSYLAYYTNGRKLVKACTWSGYTGIVEHKIYRYPLRIYGLFVRLVEKCKKIGGKVLKRLKRYLSFFSYWWYSMTPKRKNLWVATSFYNGGYLDNAKDFYEYVSEHNPEIDIYWLTKDKGVYKRLKNEGKKVCLTGTKECRKILSHAEIAVTDHFVSSDYTPLIGFNNKLKIVQLWHGVGFKSMGDGKKIKNTDVRGARYSSDIVANDKDNIIVKFFKRIKYFFVAPFRELFEEYFMFICPGPERYDSLASVWHIDFDRCFVAGQPRDLPMYSTVRQQSPIKIMYAPTYRFDYKREMSMVRDFLKNTDKIQALMEKTNGEFYLRMHPHTWRSYSDEINKTLDKYDRIFLHTAKDVYPEIGTFSIGISDYSSISLDFALIGCPVVFHCADYEWYMKHEAGFYGDFKSLIPGPMTDNWDDTLNKIEQYCNDMSTDKELREEKLKYFFDKAANGPDNSARIAEEIKRRINLN